MSSYFGIFKMSFKNELQYRAKAISGIFTQFFWGLMYISLYTAFMKTNLPNGFTLSQMATYIWLGQSFLMMRFISTPSKSTDDIVNGNVCYNFVRPINLYNQWYFSHIGKIIASTILRFLPIMIIAVFLPKNMALSLPVSFTAFTLFVLTLIIGALINASLSMIAVYITFTTQSPKGSLLIVSTVTGLFSGMFVPIPIMPLRLQKVLNFLPFRYITDLPFRIYMGNTPIMEALKFCLIAVVWLIILVVAGKLLINSASKKTVIQGG